MQIRPLHDTASWSSAPATREEKTAGLALSSGTLPSEKTLAGEITAVGPGEERDEGRQVILFFLVFFFLKDRSPRSGDRAATVRKSASATEVRLDASELMIHERKRHHRDVLTDRSLAHTRRPRESDRP